MSGPREASVQWTAEQAGMLSDLIKDGVTSFNRAAVLLNDIRLSLCSCELLLLTASSFSAGSPNPELKPKA